MKMMKSTQMRSLPRKAKIIVDVLKAG